MNVRKTLILSFVVALAAVSAAQAGPTIGTAKARGDYRGWNTTQSQRSVTRSRPAYQYRAPAMQSSPMIARTPAAVAPAPQIAQAPVESRRFSYAPATDNAAGARVVAGSPCAPAAATPQSGRRFSYSPTEPSVAPAVSAPRVYSGGSGYSRSRRGSATVDRWALPKTDPRKFND
jgi:hypothetical protein